MSDNKKIIKIFQTEKVGIQNILNNLDPNNLSIFFKLCNKAKKAIKEKKKNNFFWKWWQCIRRTTFGY